MNQYSDNDKKLRIKFCINNNESEDIISNTKLQEYFSNDQEKVIVLKCITSHQGPISNDYHDCKRVNVVELKGWENGELITEPLKTKEKGIPVTSEIYSEEYEYGLLDTAGWNTLKPFAKHEKMVVFIVNQAEIWSFFISPKFKNTYEVSQTPEQEMSLGEKMVELNCMIGFLTAS
jgi:hypothetical protein